MYFLGALIIGIIIAFLITGSMKEKMNTAVVQRAAANYVREGSFDLRTKRDVFLHEHTTRTLIETHDDHDDDHDDDDD